MANSFYLDASAVAKRYVAEPGTALVNVIFNTVAADRLYILNIGLAEIVSILVRKRNGGLISQAHWGQALIDFDNEIVGVAEIRKEPVTRRLVTASFALVVAHSINSTDALILKSALAIARKLRKSGDDLVLAASDQRLLRAAQAEGLTTFNPETQGQPALAALL